MKPKKDLLRVVRSPEGVAALDLRGKASGRGAYVCANPECLKRSVKSRALGRALGVPIPDDVSDALAAEVEKARVQNV
jgi:predicted RNA-binding protein YlxR (DUF448 family)